MYVSTNVYKSNLVLNYKISAINCAAFNVQIVSRQTDRSHVENTGKKSLSEEIKSTGSISHMDEIRQAVLYLQCFPYNDHVVFVPEVDQIKLYVVYVVHDSVGTTWDRRMLGLPKLAAA